MIYFLAADTAYDGSFLELAFDLFSQAANNGDDSAMSPLAIMYSEVESVLRNIGQSNYWDLKAIEFANQHIHFRVDNDRHFLSNYRYIDLPADISRKNGRYIGGKEFLPNFES